MDQFLFCFIAPAHAPSRSLFTPPSSLPSFFQSDDLRHNSSRMDGEQSKNIVRLLNSATSNTPHYYGNDVKTAATLLNLVLLYESQQEGFDLTAMRDAEFNEVENKNDWM